MGQEKCLVLGHVCQNSVCKYKSRKSRKFKPSQENTSVFAIPRPKQKSAREKLN